MHPVSLRFFYPYPSFGMDAVSFGSAIDTISIFGEHQETGLVADIWAGPAAVLAGTATSITPMVFPYVGNYRVWAKGASANGGSLVSGPLPSPLV